MKTFVLFIFEEITNLAMQMIEKSDKLILNAY